MQKRNAAPFFKRQTILPRMLDEVKEKRKLNDPPPIIGKLTAKQSTIKLSICLPGYLFGEIDIAKNRGYTC